MLPILTAGLWIGPFVAGCSEYGLEGDRPSAQPEGSASELAAERHIDRVVQPVPPVVDLLWVVDGSGSMTPDLDGVRAKLPHFLEALQASGADYHVGIVSISAGPEGAALQEADGVRWVDPDTPDPEGVMNEMIDTLPMSLEQGRTAAFSALEDFVVDWNPGFLRPNASAGLHITVISDENDKSHDDPVSIEEFAAWMTIVAPYPERRSFNSVVVLQLGDPEESIGYDYVELTDLVGGTVWDLHADPWEVIFDDLIRTTVPAPSDTIALSRLPVPESLEVSVLHQGTTFRYESGADFVWLPQSNAVRFLAGPRPVGSEITVSYEVAR